jgi:hypothetical protein
VRRNRADRHRIVKEPPSSAILIAKLWSISSRNSLRVALPPNDPVATICCNSWLIGSWGKNGEIKGDKGTRCVLQKHGRR